MNHRTAFVLLALNLSFFSFAQSNFKRGQVVTLSGEVQPGLIDFKGWVRTPTQFTFKPSADGKEKISTVRNAQMVEITDYARYERFAVQVSMNDVNVGRIDPSAATPESRPDTVFLKVVATGSQLHLYSYRDKLKERFYVRTPAQTTPEELAYSIRMENQNLSASYTYRLQLNRMASRSPHYTPQLQTAIGSALYSEKELKKIANQINGTIETTAVVAQRKLERGRFFTAIGINAASMTYSGKNVLTANGLDHSGRAAYNDPTTTRSYLPVLAAGYDYFFHAAIRRSYLRTELSATAVRSNVHSFYKFPQPYDEELTIDYKVHGVFVSLSPQLIYNIYHQPNLRIHAGAGAAVRYAFYPEQSYQQDTNKEGPGYADVSNDDYFDMKRLFVVPQASAGADVGRKAAVFLNWFAPVRLVTNYDGSSKSSIKTGSLQGKVVYFF